MERILFDYQENKKNFCEYRKEVAPFEFLNRDEPIKISGISQDDIQQALKVADEYVSGAKYLGRGGAAYAMLRSFRFKGSFSVISGLIRLTPAMNVSGNLRGMVTSAKGRGAFNSLKSGSQFLANAALAISFVQELAAEQPYIEKVISSDETVAEKASKLYTTTLSAITRTAGSIFFTAARIPPYIADEVFGEENSLTKQRLLRWENEFRLVTSPENVNDMFLHLNSEVSAYLLDE
ncbi:hypothetical protein [Roseibium sp.]|uniref:hypothetical protein n=1 Tax=Roseibium sp. TaxID=1936156 RepID=UPI003B51E6AA